MSGTSRDVGIKVTVTSDVQGAAQIEAAFAKVGPAIVAAMQKAQTAATAAEAPLKAVKEAASNFDGSKLAAQASAAAKGVEAIGGVSKLTAAELTRTKAVVDEAIAKFKIMGKDVPPDIARLAGEIKKVSDASAAADKAVKPWTAGLKGAASSLDGLISKIPGGEILGKPFSTGAKLVEEMSGKLTGLVSKIPGLSGLGSALGPLPAILGPIAIGLGLVLAGVVGVTAAALKLGAESSAAFATLAQKTGLVGPQLQGLETSLRHLAGTSTQSMGEVATGLALVSARTGQTGPALEGLTKQLLQLSKVTGTDMTANVANTTRMFGDWGIATDKQSSALDKLYKASQLTGAGTDQLSQKIVAYGAPLRQLGFSYEQSLAMLGKWEKEGVNTELVLGSMKKAVGALAEANIPLDGGFVALRDKIKAAGSDMEAFGIAKAAVGVRGASDLSAAVREGRFDFMELQKGIEGGSGAIKNAAAQSAGLGGQFKLMGNAAKAGLAPLTDAVFDIATKLVQQAVPAVQAFWSQIGDKLAPLAIRAKDALIPLIEKIGPVLTSAVTGVLPHLMNMGTLFGTVLLMLQPVGDFIMNNLQPILITLAGVGIGAVVAAAVVAGPILMGLAGSVLAIVSPALAAAAPFIALGAAVGIAVAYIVTHWEELKGYLTAADAWVRGALDSIGATFAGWGTSISESVSSLVALVTSKATALWDQLTGIWQSGVKAVLGWAASLWDGLLSSWEGIRVGVSGAVAGLWAWLSEAWTNGVAYVSSVVIALGQNLMAAWTWISTTVSGLVARLINWLQTSWGRAGTWLGGLLTRIANMFAQAWTWIRNAVGGVVTKLVNAAVGAFRWLGQKAAGIWERMQDMVGAAWTGIIGIFKGAAGGIVTGMGHMFSKIVELAAKGLKGVGSAIYRIFTAILDKIKALLAGLGLGDIFASLMPDADGGGAGWLDGIAASVGNAARSVMDGIGSVMTFFEAKWDSAKTKLQGFFDQSETLQDQADSQATYSGPSGGGAAPADISGLGGGGASGGAPKSMTAPDGMSGREADGSEWYIDPATGKKIYTSGPKKNQQDAKERGADAKAAAKGSKAGKGGAAGEGSEDPAVSAAKTAADTAARISEALQKAANTLRDLGRTELPGESVWGPKIAAIEVFIQASMDSFDRLAVGLLDKIGQTEAGAELLDTAKGKAISAVSSLTGGMVDSMTKVSSFLQGLVKAKWPTQAQIDVAFGLIGDALSRVQAQSLLLAEKVGVGSGKEGEKSPAEHMTAVGASVSGWIDAHLKTATLLDALAKVKMVPAGALELVQATMRSVADIMASFLKGPGYDLTADSGKTAADLEVSRDAQATLGAGLDVVTKAAAAGEAIARTKAVPAAAWQNVQAIMLGASLALAALVRGPDYDLTRDPERTAIALTVARDQVTTMNTGLDLVVKASVAGRQLAKAVPIPAAAWANVQSILSETSKILASLVVGPGYNLLADSERTAKDLGVVQTYTGVLGSGVGLVVQASGLGSQFAKAAPIPAGALESVQATLSGVSKILAGLVVGPGYNLLADAARTTADLAVVSTVVRSMSEALGLIAQTSSVGDMLAKAKPFDTAAATVALANARAALAAVEHYATEYAAGFKDATFTVEDQLAQVQQYAAALREALGLIDAAGKFKLGRVLPVDARDVDQAVQNAKLAFERLHFWATVFEQGMVASGFDVDVVIESVKRYSAALRDAVSLVDTAGKLKLDGILPLSAADVNQAVINAQLAFDRLHFWATTMADRLEASGFEVGAVFEQVKAYTAALKDALSLVEAAGKFALSDVVLVDPIDVDRAVKNADIALRLVTDWARAWHASLEGQKRIAEDVLTEISAYSKVIKEALDLVQAAVGLAFEDTLPLNESSVRQALQNADTALRIVEEFSAGWRARFATLEGELGAAQLRAQAEEIELYTKAAGSALDLIGRAATLVVDAVAPLDPSLVTASLDKARVVLDMVQAAAASWAKSIRDGGRNLQEVSAETEAFQKGAAGSFDLLLKVHDFIEKVTSPRILEPLEKGAKRLPAPAIEATLAELSRVITLVMTSLGAIYDDPAVSAAIPKAEQLTSKLAPAVDALVKVLDLFSLERLMKSPLFDLKIRSAGVSTNAAKTRMEQLRKQIVEGVQRTVSALVDALKGIKVPADLGGDGLDRLAAMYDHIAAILERIASLEMPDPAKLDEFLAASQKLVGGGKGAPGGGLAEGMAVAGVASSGGIMTLKTENKITVNNNYNQYGDNNFFDEKATKLMLDRLGSFGVRVRP